MIYFITLWIHLHTLISLSTYTWFTLLHISTKCSFLSSKALLLFSHWVMSNSLWPQGLYSVPGFPVLYYLPELLKIMSIELVCHPTISSSVTCSSSSLSLSQHQGLFQWVNSSHWVAKVLELQLKHSSFQWIFRVDFQAYSFLNE